MFNLAFDVVIGYSARLRHLFPVVFDRKNRSDAFDGGSVVQRSSLKIFEDNLLQTKIRAILRRPDQRVAWNERAVRTETRAECGARIPQVQKLAEEVFQLPALVGRTNSISGLRSALDQPEFATGIGLVKFGSFQQRKEKERGSLRRGLKTTLSQLFGRS